MKWNEWTEEDRRHVIARTYRTFTLEPSGIPVRDSALVDIVVELAGDRIETLRMIAAIAPWAQVVPARYTGPILRWREVKADNVKASAGAEVAMLTRGEQ